MCKRTILSMKMNMMNSVVNNYCFYFITYIFILRAQRGSPPSPPQGQITKTDEETLKVSVPVQKLKCSQREQLNNIC